MMNRYLGWLAAVVLFGAGLTGSAQAYIIAQDVEQPLPDDQPSWLWARTDCNPHPCAQTAAAL